ncbi:MAG: nuclear transport factor 2 family protein [Desulfobacteraceae bacterium]|nr:MAG: nuclear transport factor 2 family protein [Desulfobacteraceae bacterium]
MIENTVKEWHAIVASLDATGLDRILADNVVFHSPVVHTPQAGKQLTTLYLAAAFQVLNNDTFTYVREVVSGNDAVLEFSTIIDGIVVNGVDMIRWRADGKIVDFKVMIRPLKGFQLVHQKMAEMLQKLTSGK